MPRGASRNGPPESAALATCTVTARDDGLTRAPRNTSTPSRTTGLPSTSNATPAGLGRTSSRATTVAVTPAGSTGGNATVCGSPAHATAHHSHIPRLRPPTIPRSDRQRAPSASATRSRSSAVWAALTVNRSRSRPASTVGQRMAGGEHAALQQPLGQGQRRRPHHERHHVGVAERLPAEVPQGAAQAGRVGRERGPQRVVGPAEARERHRRRRLGQRRGEHEAPGAVLEERHQRVRPRHERAERAERLAERAHEAVRRDPLRRRHPPATRPEGADGVGLVDEQPGRPRVPAQVGHVAVHRVQRLEHEPVEAGGHRGGVGVRQDPAGRAPQPQAVDDRGVDERVAAEGHPGLGDRGQEAHVGVPPRIEQQGPPPEPLAEGVLELAVHGPRAGDEPGAGAPAAAGRCLHLGVGGEPEVVVAAGHEDLAPVEQRAGRARRREGPDPPEAVVGPDLGQAGLPPRVAPRHG
jgi:hypothetical protein